MSKVYDWLTSLVDCKAVAQFFTPTPPVNFEEHLRKTNQRLDALEAHKIKLMQELRALQRQREDFKRRGQSVQIIEQQLLKHLEAIKELDARNLQIVAQYNEVARANNRKQMLETSVETAKMLSELGRDMRQQLKQVGGTSSIQETIDVVGDTMEEADRLTAFTSRAVIPEGMDTFRETGVLPVPLSLDEQLAEYLDMGKAASSVSEPAVRASPYAASAPVEIPLGVHEPA